MYVCIMYDIIGSLPNVLPLSSSPVKDTAPSPLRTLLHTPLSLVDTPLPPSEDTPLEDVPSLPVEDVPLPIVEDKLLEDTPLFVENVPLDDAPLVIEDAPLPIEDAPLPVVEDVPLPIVEDELLEGSPLPMESSPLPMKTNVSLLEKQLQEMKRCMDEASIAHDRQTTELMKRNEQLQNQLNAAYGKFSHHWNSIDMNKSLQGELNKLLEENAVRHLNIVKYNVHTLILVYYSTAHIFS